MDVAYRNIVKESDISVITALTRNTDFFREDEVLIAQNLIAELVIDPESIYKFLIAEVQGQVVGYTCYNKIECSLISYDLDWVVVDKNFQGQQIGKALLRKTEDIIFAAGGKFIYAETSGQALYENTRKFYLACNFKLAAEFPDFYDFGDNKLVFVKKLF
ncbi:MAG: GNAT family N-acetyltransferase [Deltaproteobacteria bacterium]|jgi:GNAT superfamily N-acetyltransferase|nr:GNAT family N-acetyltransferase [Deltaproteobacteria bacterium]